MSHDRVTRVAAVLVCAAGLAAASGCRRSPFQRLMDGPVEAPLKAASGPQGPPAPAMQATSLPAPVMAAVGPQRDDALLQTAMNSATRGEEHTGTSIDSLPRPWRITAGPATADSRPSSQAQSDFPNPPVIKATVLPASQPAVAEPAPWPLAVAPSVQRVKIELKSQIKPSPPAPSPPKVAAKGPAIAPGQPRSRIKDPGVVKASLDPSVSTLGEMGPPDLNAVPRAFLEHAAKAPAPAVPLAELRPAAPLDPRTVLAALVREDREPLTVSGLRLCRKIEGYGTFEPIESSRLRPGQSVLLYSELTGLRYQPRDRSYITRLASRVEFLNKDGTRVWEQPLGEDEDECQSRRRDNFTGCRLTLPESLEAGDYRLRLIQTDLVARQTASAELPLSIARQDPP